MGLHSSFETLSNVLKEFDEDSQSTRRVEVTAEQHASVSATVEVSASFSDLLNEDSPLSCSPSTASIDDAGPFVTFRFEDLSSTLLPEVTESPGDGEPNLSISPNKLETRDGEILIELNLIIDLEEDEYPNNVNSNEFRGISPRLSKTAADTDSDTAGSEGVELALKSARTDSVPPFEDTEYLRRLYEISETFGEMSDLIELDVSAETVRRYMIDAGIHSPESYATIDQSQPARSTDNSVATDARPVNGSATRSTQDSEDSPSDRVDSPQPELDSLEAESAEPLPKEDLLTDGVGFPDDVTLRELAEVVVQARTVHEVHRHLGIDHERTRELLRQLNVLDLVVNRFSIETEQRVTFETVAERIREST